MKSQPWYVYVLLGILLVGLVYLGYFKRRETELKNLRAERAKIEGEVTNLKSKKRQLDKIEGELVGLNKALTELEVIIPRRKEHGEILRNIQQMASESQLEVIHFTPEKEINRDFYSEQPIPIEIVGNYHNLGLFFDRILHFPRIFNIDGFLIKTLPNQSEEFTISALFTAKTYFFLEESQLKKPALVKPNKPLKEENEIR